MAHDVSIKIFLNKLLEKALLEDFTYSTSLILFS